MALLVLPLQLRGQADSSAEAVDLTTAVIKARRTGVPILAYIFDST